VKFTQDFTVQWNWLRSSLYSEVCSWVYFKGGLKIFSRYSCDELLFVRGRGDRGLHTRFTTRKACRAHSMCCKESLYCTLQLYRTWMCSLLTCVLLHKRDSVLSLFWHVFSVQTPVPTLFSARKTILNGKHMSKETKERVCLVVSNCFKETKKRVC